MGGLGVKVQHFPLTLLVVLTTLTLPCERDVVKSKEQNCQQTLSAFPNEPKSWQLRRSAEQLEVEYSAKLLLVDLLLSGRLAVGAERSAVDRFSCDPLPSASPLLGL